MELFWQAMSHRLPVTALVSSLAVAFGCSSEPLASAPGGVGGTSAAGAGGSGGSGGSGAAGAGGAPDYTTSPCYGQKRTTLVYDFSTHMPTETTATCRAEGDRTLVYVADALWENPFTQAEVNAFMDGYELRGRETSFNPGLGVLPVDELVFGNLNGPLNEGRLVNDKLPIFVVSSGGAGDGYLCGWCEGVELHLDGPLLRSLHTDKTLSIAAHETVHAIHRGYDADETVWVDESLAQAAMTANGYFTDQVWLESFLADTNIAWGPGVEDPREFNYGAGLLFGSYLWEQGGPELLTAIVHEPLDDWAGLEAAFDTVGEPRRGLDLFLDMAISIFLDGSSSHYTFDAFDLAGAVSPTTVATGTTYRGTLAPYGLVYLVFDESASALRLTAPATVTAKLVAGEDPRSSTVVPRGAPVDLGADTRVLVLTATAAASITLAVE
jgi:hypothetical protein